MNKENKEVFVFDMDDTLILSNQKMDDEMIDLFCNLLAKKKVAIISGQGLENIKRNIVSHLKCDNCFDNLFLLPNGGSRMLKFKDQQLEVEYSYDFTDEEIKEVMSAFRKSLAEWGWEMEDHPEYYEKYGPILQNRGSSVNFSALGADAPVEIKRLWDPLHKKRHEIMAILQPLIPNYVVKSGGTTTIDVTKKGLDKAFAVVELSKILDISLDNFVYIGDALFEGGNDEPILRLGIDTVDVFDPEKPIVKTKEYIRSIL